MIYFDNAATTFTNDEVLDTFYKVTKEFKGNSNSLHKLGLESRKLMDASIEQIATLLKVKKEEVIITSGASESNNLAIKGVVEKYKNRGKQIITTKLEHSSVLECMNYLETIGYKIDYVNILENGKVDINNLKELLSNDTLLVSIHHVNSEVGFYQDINEIGKILKEYPKTIFHVDGTQALGKINVSLENIDLYSFSSHKFFGIKGSGGLIKKSNIELEPLIHGGKSQSNYRSGTPALPLIVSTAKALRLALTDLDKKYNNVKNLSDILKEKLKNIAEIEINSNENSIPHIINFSVKNIKPETLLHALEKEDIYISTKTACSKDSSGSLTLKTIGKDLSISNHSLRVSINHLNNEEEINIFVEKLKKCISELKF